MNPNGGGGTSVRQLRVVVETDNSDLPADLHITIFEDQDGGPTRDE
jgi:hypothetical protein